MTDGERTSAFENQALYNANFTDLPIDIASLFRAVWRRKWIIAGIWLLVQLLAVFSILQSTPVYQSQAALELKALPALPKSDLHSETSMSKVDEKKFMEAMKRLLSSRKLAMMVVEKMGLTTLDEQPPQEPPMAPEDVKKIYLEIIQNSLSVSIEKGGVTGVINLSYLDESPERAEDILTTLIDQFWLILYERPEIAFAKERNHIKLMIDNAKQKLDVAYDNLNTFLSKNDIFFLENIDVMTKKDIEITSSQLLELSKKAEEASHERIEAEAILKQAELNMDGVREINDSTVISSMKEELAKARAQYADLTAIYTPRHSAVQEVAARIQSIEKSIENERGEIMVTLRKTYETAIDKEKDLDARVENMKNEVIAKKALKGQYDAIEAEIEINRKVYQSVLQQYEALKIETVFPFTLNMIDPPLVSKRPVKPDKGFRMMVAFIIGFVFGGSLALLIEFTNPGLRAPVEAERRTGLPMLGAVPPLRKRKILDKINAKEKFNQLNAWPEFTRSFNNTVGIMLSKPGIGISITSPTSHEGKILAAMGISRQLMYAGKRVLLIDADFSDAMIDQVFDLDDSHGLLNVLEAMVRDKKNDISLKDFKPIAKSAGGGLLYALKSGATTEASPVGLIETPEFVELVRRLKQEVDYVIVITPPLLKEVAAYIINKALNATIMVLRERQSRIKDAVRATEVMYRVGISILGFIVTESEYYDK